MDIHSVRHSEHSHVQRYRDANTHLFMVQTFYGISRIDYLFISWEIKIFNLIISWVILRWLKISWGKKCGLLHLFWEGRFLVSNYLLKISWNVSDPRFFVPIASASSINKTKPSWSNIFSDALCINTVFITKWLNLGFQIKETQVWFGSDLLNKNGYSWFLNIYEKDWIMDEQTLEYTYPLE